MDLPQAFITGYHMNYTAFKKLVQAIDPKLTQVYAQVDGASPGYISYAYYFNKWKLSLPEDDYRRVPILRLIHDLNPDHQLNKYNHDPEYTKFFYATRHIDAPEDSIIEDFPEVIDEREDDRAQRDDFIAIVKKHTVSAYSVHEAALQFGCFRHPHPMYDKGILENAMTRRRS